MSVLYHFFVCKTILNTKGCPLCVTTAPVTIFVPNFSKYMILYIIEFLYYPEAVMTFTGHNGDCPHCVIGGITK